tara:strand:+ start:198 stop:455 length:258 start_codon:yes stop_codon:yes gene_type:complete
MMLKKLILDKAKDAIIKKIAKKWKLSKVLDYVEKQNDADERIDKVEIDVFHHDKRLNKLEQESHEPIFTKKQYNNILKRLDKLEG